MKLTPKQIKFFRNIFVKINIQIIAFLPVTVPFVTVPLFILYDMPAKVFLPGFLLMVGIFFSLIAFKCDAVYDNFFNIAETEELTFFQTLKLAIKRAFCNHYSREWTTAENPKPMIFLDLKAKCSDCGVENYEITRKAVEDYKIRLADNILFQRNIDKFPEFYKDKLASIKGANDNT